nr:immunoglobulin light chain junction region [Macaca mulatta]MOV34380.1 immunoglobulin light chain junction region [Macaca mulatta]
CQHVYGIPFTF